MDARPAAAVLPPDIAARIRAGDAKAFELAFRTYYQPLCSFAARFVRDSAAAEDLVQDVFGAIWTERATMEIKTGVRAYLYASVRNRALNLRKHEGVADDWDRDESSDDVRELHPRPMQPDALLDRKLLEAQLEAAFNALPERAATALRLRWRDELSYAEIAEAMAISVKGVEKLLSRGLRALRMALLSEERSDEG
jgi:RNA polymerase sigma-70 factor (ECF subfamily)